jgi:hypothetical protein
MIHWPRFAATLFISVAAFLLITPARAASTYTITVVAPFSQQYRSGLALNNRGHVTGQTTGAQAFFYDGTLHLLGKPAGAKFSVGEGISDTDVIAATAQVESVRNAYAVTYSGGHAAWTKLAGLPGYAESQAEGITPDGRAVTGELCATGDPACSHLATHSLAVVWSRSGSGWWAPRVLAAGKGATVSSAAGIARNGTTTVVAGTIAPVGTGGRWKSVLWLLPLNRPFQLTGQGAYTQTRVSAIAHGSGTTFYVAGSLYKPNLATPYGEGALWTVTCTASACRQTGLQIVTPFGETYAVNSHGVVTGYDRTDGGAGTGFVWQNGKETLGGPSGVGINNSGQMVAWRIHPVGTRNAQVILRTPET